MEPVTDVPLKKTPLHARHRASGARMVAFAGWDMPVEYSGIVAEHMAVRTRAGLFDVSHMGEIEVAGTDALAAVQRISSNDASKLQVGQAQYSGLLTSQGTFLDDLLVYRLAPQHFLLVVNAANIDKDFGWIDSEIKAAGDVVAVNASSRYALLSVQGPAALEVIQPLTGVDLQSMKYYRLHG
jgi:aminomethyltransferase